MDYLYSLYDALVSINVPNDKARAVVDAMERDMTTTIATKADLLLVKQDLQLVKTELLGTMARLATREETEKIRTELGELRKDNGIIHQHVSDIEKDLAHLATTVTVRVTTALGVVIGLLFAALKLTS